MEAGAEALDAYIFRKWRIKALKSKNKMIQGALVIVKEIVELFKHAWNIYETPKKCLMMKA